MNIAKIIKNTLSGKPMSLQQGLSRVKKRMGAIGEDLAKTPGVRIYMTKGGDRIYIKSDPKGIEVQKILSKQSLKAQHYNHYVGTLAGVKREYNSRNLSSQIRRFQTFMTISIFRPKNTALTLDRKLVPGAGSIVHNHFDGSVRESTKLCNKYYDFNRHTGIRV